jgi:hypothetical protein
VFPSRRLVCAVSGARGAAILGGKPAFEPASTDSKKAGLKTGSPHKMRPHGGEIRAKSGNLAVDKLTVKIITAGLLITISMAALSAQKFVESAPKQSGSKAKWIRRATLVAGCAASLVFDTLSTRRAVADGAIESNPLLTGSNGNVSWGRAIGLKAGLCGGSAVIQETHVFGSWKTPAADWAWTLANAGTASVYTWAGFHNLNLARDLPIPATSK